MKKVLFMFLQVVCLISLGQAPLNAHPNEDSVLATSLTATEPIAAPIDFFSVKNFSPDTHIDLFIQQQNSKFLNESITEIETEPSSGKKIQANNDYFLKIFGNSAPEFTSFEYKNSLAVCRQVNFVPKKDILIELQVFRI